MFSHLLPPQDAHAPIRPDDKQRFMQLLGLALERGGVQRLLLSAPRPVASRQAPQGGQESSGAAPRPEGKDLSDEPGLERLMVRELQLRGERHLSFLWRYQTRDVTKNLALDPGLAELNRLLGPVFGHAHLDTATESVQLRFSRKGRPSLHVARRATPADAGEPPAAQSGAHNREKPRLLDLQQPFWRDLGLSHAPRGEPQLVPTMARKWKQINKFIEIFDAAVRSAGLAAPVRLADFGSGKGYLTFAMHDYLRQQGLAPQVHGVELREDMVTLCNAVARTHGLQGLVFEQGDVRERGDMRLDVMVALHACDIATDYAMHFGLRSGARIIMCAPCCHKQIRPQMRTPAALRPLLQHGIHLGQEAEMVTDSLRALLLELCGYETQVIEFIALEHTSKNKMVLAVRRAQDPTPARRAELLAQLDEIKRFYGLREQALESLLRAEGRLAP